MNVERRNYQGELRQEERQEVLVLAGHAAVFNKPIDLNEFTEEVLPGAFSETIAKDDVRALFNHNDDLVLGRNRAGTLRLAEDDVGLRVEIDPPDTQFARDLLTLIRRGDISGMSFGFLVEDENWDFAREKPHRQLRKVRLFDVSPVTFPAYESTDISLALQRMEERRKREEIVPRWQLAVAERERYLRLLSLK